MIITKNTNSKIFFSVDDAIYKLQKKLSVVVVYVYVPREYLNVMRFEYHNQIFWLLFPRLLRDMLKTISVTFLYEHFHFGHTHRKLRLPYRIAVHQKYADQ